MSFDRQLVNSIKEFEGFDGMPYDDSKGLPTIGYGTLLPITKEEAELLLNHRLNIVKEELLYVKPIVSSLTDNRQRVLFNMGYQLGVPKLLKFKKMWRAIVKQDYDEASKEMLDSKWAKKDSPNRANKLAEIMKRG